MKTAFVASTLPAFFIKENLDKLNLGAIICANNNLLKSYSFLLKKNENLILIGLNSHEELNTYSQSEYFEDILIFHECCWLELDVLIIKHKPVVHYYPCVTLVSFILLERKDINLLFLFFSFLFSFDRIKLKLFFLVIRYSNYFDIYKMRLDGGDNKYDYVTKLKTNLFENILYNDSCLECRKKIETFQSFKKINSKIVIFLLATDVIDNGKQLEIFTNLKRICENIGLRVLFKNHPNEYFRLPYPSDWESISPFDPFETLEIDYLFKVGLFSTSLLFEPNKSISISEMLFINDNNFEKRKLHISNLLNNAP